MIKKKWTKSDSLLSFYMAAVRDRWSCTTWRPRNRYTGSRVGMGGAPWLASPLALQFWTQWPSDLHPGQSSSTISNSTRNSYAFARYLTGSFFVRFEGSSIFTKKLKTRFFPLKLDFSAILRKFYISWWILEENLSGVTLFMPFLLTKFLEKGKNLQFSSINRGNSSKNEEICCEK